MEGVHDRYLSVSQATRKIKSTLEAVPEFREIYIRGEISNFKHHSRGHMYFSLKDQHSKISAVMFAGNNRHLKFRPESGMNVLIKGRVSVYEPYGQYQLYAEMMEPDGIGQLYLAYEQLKKKLEEEGLFSPEHKQPLPPYPTRIAVVTSKTGAVIRDIYTTIKRRYPLAGITLFPVAVQGDQSVPSILHALERINAMQGFDVAIVGRGGGSIEELWSFNDEAVARAVAASHIPIISAVGHETDVTITDFVADVRAATPTAAAEVAVPDIIELKNKVGEYQRRLSQQLFHSKEQKKAKLQHLQRSYAFKYPAHLLQQKEQELDRFIDSLNRGISTELQQAKTEYKQLTERLHRVRPTEKVQEGRLKVEREKERLQKEMQHAFERSAARLTTNIQQLEILNPLHVLKRGFSVGLKQNGRAVRSVNEVTTGEEVQLLVADGQIKTSIQAVEETNPFAHVQSTKEEIDDE
ncbi:exodeoxyribonuclease VII large subunit [Salsuginibacillus kocurii]|uniref:exodeoxyribonuclease VII large subunit n=1 Tax=Salsuginibacillus kocurii TaxID=427078 RepID=UPI00037BE020|nr:exodeoxyribonuclease VII large subunit [Salsuginibacillus kocurii]